MSERNPYLRANSLAELLFWHDEDFVRCAYATILGRQPDREGESYFVERVRQGHSRLAILWQLRRSAEGRRHDPGIRGLDQALRRAARQRLPIVGAFFRLTAADADGNSAATRYRRARLNAATVERYTLYGIGLKLEAIQRVLEQSHPDAPEEPSSKRLSFPDGRVLGGRAAKALRHLVPSSPLARFFSSEA